MGKDETGMDCAGDDEMQRDRTVQGSAGCDGTGKDGTREAGPDWTGLDEKDGAGGTRRDRTKHDGIEQDEMGRGGAGRSWSGWDKI